MRVDGPALAAGRDCEIYPAGPGRVVRRSRDGRSLEREARVMRHVAAHGFPVPEVFDAEGAEILMERVEGPDMLTHAGRRPLGRLRRHAHLLADLHRRLAAVPPPAWLPMSEEFPGDALLHLDLHPLNVLLTERGPTVIDWANARRGAAGAEVASTWMIMATSEIPGRTPVRAVLELGRRSFLRTFLDDLGRDQARPHLAAIGDHRRSDHHVLPSEVVRIDRLVATESRPPPG